MTNTNESKLSNILARMIVAPEDRSQLLPLTTPIYCPDNNGVTASKVQIINPNLGFLYDNTIITQQTPASKILDTFNTSQQTIQGSLAEIRDLMQNGKVGEVINLNIQYDFRNITSFTGYSGMYAIMSHPAYEKSAHIDFTSSDKGTNLRVTAQSSTGGSQTSTHITLSKSVFGHIINVKVVFKVVNGFSGSTFNVTVYDEEGEIGHYNGYKTLTNFGSGSYGLSFNKKLGDNVIIQANTYLERTTVAPDPTTETSTTRRTLGGKSTINRKVTPTGELISSTGVDAGLNTDEFKNVQDITMDQPLILTYTVPHEVDLESNINLVDLIKADFAVKFKAAVSNYVLNYLKVNKASIGTVAHGDTLAGTLGKVIADNAENGTGQKFSILKYSNGAPVPYNFNSNQPNIDKVILKKQEGDDECQVYMSDYACINEINVPALYYCEKPTVILPQQTFEDYQVARIDGTIKSYADEKLNVDSADVVLTEIGEGIYGSNDVFAVAFTQPKIVESDNTEFFAKDVTIAIYYGVALVNDKNLRIIE